MPTYEYRCDDCGRYFEVNATVEQKKRGLELNCPDCGSQSHEQVFGGISILSGKAVDRNASSGGCCAADGTGCC